MQKRHFILSAILLLWGVYAQAQGCQANFQWSPISGLVNGVQFADSSSWTITSVDSVSYVWSFGDGSSGSGPIVSHIYNAPGQYTVCLTISLFNPNGVSLCANTSCQTIILTNNPCNGLAAQVNLVQNNTVLQAVVTGGTPPYSYSWSNASSVTSVLTPNASGNYCVIVTDAVGCAVTACQFYPGNGGGGCTFGVNIVSVQSGVLQVVVDSSIAANPNLQYNWSNGAFGPSLLTSGLAAGVYCVSVSDNNNCTGSACYTLSGGGGCLDTICGYTFNDMDGNGILDPTDSLLPGVYVVYFGGGLQGTALSDANGFYSFTIPCNTNVQVQTYTQSSFSVITIPLGSGVNSGTPGTNTGGYIIMAGNAGCGYNFGFSNHFITISGKIYADLNANGQADAGELGIPYQPVQLQAAGGGQYTAYTNASGQYLMQLPVDTYQIGCSLTGNYSGLSVLPAQHTANGSSAGQSFPNKNFGAQIPAGSVNLSVNLMPHTTVTPGFPAWYTLQVCNVGFTPTGGTADLFFDPNLVFDNASPAPLSVNNTTHTASWNIPLLAPGQCTSIWIDFNTLVSATLGNSTFELASVIPTGGNDAVMSNNVDTVHQIVVGSWDPNNKLSVQTNYSNPAYQYVSSINADREIEYTINFQNTGTAPAVNVVVLDELSADLDAETFTLISTSHPCVATREGSSVEFKFSNIMLADSTNNEPESHGYITFRIHSLTGLAAGHVISDDADIYFDFNAPVNTGFSQVTQLDPTAVDEGAEGPALQVGPLPMVTYTRIALLTSGENGFSLRIVDMNGRAVRQVSSSSNTLELQRDGLSNGLYHYELTTSDARVIRGKLLVQ